MPEKANVYRIGNWAYLWRGDCLEALSSLPDSSVDAVVTDPPAGISIMASEWDKDKGGMLPWINWLSEILKEVYRVLKPGGYILCWSMPRTSHWTGTAIESAGFFPKNSILHIFGQGFPHSQNVSKAIDIAAGMERVDGEPLSDFAKDYDGFGTDLKPAYEQWWLAQKAYPAISVQQLFEKTSWDHWHVISTRKKVKYRKRVALHHGVDTIKEYFDEEQEEWCEIERKPYNSKWKTSSIAANMIINGVGALNIDKCRIEGDVMGGFFPEEPKPLSRWPAHIVLTHHRDCHVIGKRAGDSFVINRWKDGAKPWGGAAGQNLDYTSVAAGGNEVWEANCHPDCPVHVLNNTSKLLSVDGDAKAHFFMSLLPDPESAIPFLYVAKPGKKEKNAGCQHLDGAQRDKTRVPGYKGSDNPYNRGGKKQKNSHPAVKSIRLMRYLCRLICPPNGIVLDPFMGSGTTGVAAFQEGMKFMGIELSEEFFEIAKARMEHAHELDNLETVPEQVVECELPNKDGDNESKDMIPSKQQMELSESDDDMWGNIVIP